MTYGDAAFDGLIFNSPFLAWGWLGGIIAKLIVKKLPGLLAMLGVPLSWKIANGLPLHSENLKLWTAYAWHPECKSLTFKPPVTLGFCLAVNRVHARLRRVYRARQHLTLKPYLTFTSRGDGILNGEQVLLASQVIGPARTSVAFPYADHDIFASFEEAVVLQGMDILTSWLRAHFPSESPLP